MELQHYPGLILFDVNDSFVHRPLCGDDDVAVLQSHLRCCVRVRDFSNRSLGIPFGAHDCNVGRWLLVEERSVDG